jgi:phosphoribosyl-AMP cyclohydrolase
MTAVKLGHFDTGLLLVASGVRRLAVSQCRSYAARVSPRCRQAGFWYCAYRVRIVCIARPGAAFEQEGKAVTDAIERALDEIKFGPDGLVAAIAQQHDTGEVLMLAWMNREAVRVTLAEGRACYWSRSRRALWRKGETSGQIQELRELRLDCDGDAVLLLVDQTGVACHTGRRNCFFRAWCDGGWAVIAEPEIDPERLYPGQADPGVADR